MTLALPHGMQPLLILLATPVFAETKCLPGEGSVENNSKLVLEMVKANS